MSDLKFWCWKFCPYAQRTWVSFLYSGASFTYCEINPYDNRQNQAWRAISPEGKVPVVQAHGATPGLNESLVGMELVNELSKNKLMEESPVENAAIRLNTIKFDKLVTNAWYGFLMGKHGSDTLTSGWKEFISNLSVEKVLMKCRGVMQLEAQHPCIRTIVTFRDPFLADQTL